MYYITWHKIKIFSGCNLKYFSVKVVCFLFVLMVKKMKNMRQSVYQDIQRSFNKICKIKKFECEPKEKYNSQIINFWNYIFKECLILMKQIKQMAVLDRDNKVLFGVKEYAWLTNNVSYHDVALFFAERNSKGFLFKEKQGYINYALYAAYHPFVTFGERIVEKEDVFAENKVVEVKSDVFVIAKKMQALEFVLITKKNINDRVSALKKIFIK